MEYHDNVAAPWEDEYESLIKRVFSVLQCLMVAAGLLANTLLLVLFAASPRQRTVPNMFLLQRAVAEMLFFIVVVATVVISSGDLNFSVDLCSIVRFVLYMGVVGSLMFLMLFTVDSYLASRPQHHTLSYRRKVMRLTSGAAWLLAAAEGFASYFFAYSVYHEEKLVCVFGPFFESRLLQLTINAITQAVVPLVVVWVFVSLALLPRPAVPNREEGQEGPNRHLLLGLAVTFTMLHGVFWATVVLDDALIISRMIDIVYLLPFVERSMSPILVICLSEGLQQKVAGWFACCSARRSNPLPLQQLRVSCRARGQWTLPRTGPPRSAPLAPCTPAKEVPD